MTATSVTYDPVLAELWPPQRVAELLFMDAKFLSQTVRSTNFTEKVRHVALQYGRNQGRSADFAKAVANVGSAKFEEFAVTLVSDYGFGKIDGITLERTQSDRAALVNALEKESSGALEEITLSLARDTWKAGSGSLGRVAGAPAGDVITLDPNQAKFFEVDAFIVAASTETGALNAAGAATQVIAVDYENNTITVTAGGVAALSIIDNDFLFMDGDAADTGTIKKITGVRSWIPAPGDAIGALFGVTRTTHPTRLAGHRLDGTALGSKEAAIKSLIAQIRDKGGNRAKPSQVWMNPLDLDDLTTELGSKREYTRVDVPDADVGFDGVSFRGPGGQITAIDDMWIPEGLAWVTDKRSWHWSTLNAAPRIITHDGQRTLRVAGEDAIELRSVARGQLYCDAPGWNGCVSLPA